MRRVSCAVCVRRGSQQDGKQSRPHSFRLTRCASGTECQGTQQLHCSSIITITITGSRATAKREARRATAHVTTRDMVEPSLALLLLLVVSCGREAADPRCPPSLSLTLCRLSSCPDSLLTGARAVAPVPTIRQPLMLHPASLGPEGHAGEDQISATNRLFSPANASSLRLITHPLGSRILSSYLSLSLPLPASTCVVTAFSFPASLLHPRTPAGGWDLHR